MYRSLRDELLWASRWSATMRWLCFFVVEVKLLLAGYRLAVFRCGMEGPLLNRCDDVFVDAVAEAAGHLDVSDLTGGVDDDVEDDIALCAAWERGEVRFGCGEVTDESDVDVAGAEGVCTCGGVGLGGGW